jgi:hypothetical protein
MLETMVSIGQSQQSRLPEPAGRWIEFRTSILLGTDQTQAGLDPVTATFYLQHAWPQIQCVLLLCSIMVCHEYMTSGDPVAGPWQGLQQHAG